MKRILHVSLAVLADAMLIAFAVLSMPCAVLSSYRIEFSLPPLIFAAALIGLLLSIWMHGVKFGAVAGIGFFVALVPLVLWRFTAIRYGFALFRYALLDLLTPDVPFLPEATPVDPTMGGGVLPIDAIGWFALVTMAVFGLSIAWSLIRSRMVLLPLLVPLPLFMLSLVYTDLPISHWSVMLFLLYEGAALITGGLRVNDAQKYGTVAMLTFGVLLLLGGIIYRVSPPETFEPITFEQRQEMIGERVQRIYDDVTNLMNNRVKRSEDLSDEDAWHRTGDVIFEIETEEGGTWYLRAYSLGGYGFNRWKEVPSYSGAWQSITVLGRQTDGDTQTVSIRSESSEMLYVPYRFQNVDLTEIGEAYLPARGVTAYQWTVASGRQTAATLSEEEAAYLAWAAETYAVEDEETKESLLAYCESVGLTRLDSDYETALMVSAFVRAQCTYNTEPGRIPEGEDFVLYFLQQGREGYCVHFASATTAILQSMGVPARYVFGYRCSTEAGQPTEVTDEMAHAWTEVYVQGLGWLPIESTSSEQTQPEAVPTEEPQATAEPTAEPTAPPTPEPTATESDDPNGGQTTEDTPEPTETPTDTADPKPRSSENPEDEDAPKSEQKHLWRLLWLLTIPALFGGLLGAGELLRRRREKLFRQPNARAAVLAMYRYRKRLERHGAPRSEEAERLAEEATFSNHKMQKERGRMRTLVESAVSSLADVSAWKRLLRKHLLLLW